MFIHDCGNIATHKHKQSQMFSSGSLTKNENYLKNKDDLHIAGKPTTGQIQLCCISYFYLGASEISG